MYHVETIDIRPGSKWFAYADRSCLCANNMYNTTNFHLRNLMTGLKKRPEERTENEREVIELFADSIPVINQTVRDKYERKVKKIRDNKQLSAKEKEEKINKIKCRTYEMPTEKKWFAGGQLADSVFKISNNPDYRSHHVHMMQNAIKDCCEAWKGYFALLKLYKTGVLKDRPNIPKYKQSDGRTAAVFSNESCSIRHNELRFPYAVIIDKKGRNTNLRMILPVGKLPHASVDKLIEVRIVPYFGNYQVQIVTDDNVNEEDVLPKEESIINKDGTPAGVMMLDPGLDNFAAIADNKGHAPIVIKGGALKSRNQWYNKRMAFLKSCRMQGHDPKTYHPPATKRMKVISRKRDAFLKDTFYKYSHYICRLMGERDLHFLIIGHNKGQKDSINIGHVNNQSFVQIPFNRFFQILETVASGYRIRVIYQEESYTSKASFIDRDPIPAYGKDNTGSDMAAFSGKRTKRGLYRSKEGILLNADINGAANIGRKYDERLFPKNMDTSCLHQTVVSMRHNDILRESQKRKLSA